MVDTTLALKEYKKKPKGYVRQVIESLLTKAALAKIKVKADSYALRAQKISLATRVRIPEKLKRQICRSCGAFLGSSSGSRVRTQRGKVVIYCRTCRQVARIPYIAEKKKKRSISSS